MVVSDHVVAGIELRTSGGAVSAPEHLASPAFQFFKDTVGFHLALVVLKKTFSYLYHSSPEHSLSLSGVLLARCGGTSLEAEAEANELVASIVKPCLKNKGRREGREREGM